MPRSIGSRRVPKGAVYAVVSGSSALVYFAMFGLAAPWSDLPWPEEKTGPSGVCRSIPADLMSRAVPRAVPLDPDEADQEGNRCAWASREVAEPVADEAAIGPEDPAWLELTVEHPGRLPGMFRTDLAQNDFVNYKKRALEKPQKEVFDVNGLGRSAFVEFDRGSTSVDLRIWSGEDIVIVSYGARDSSRERTLATAVTIARAVMTARDLG